MILVLLKNKCISWYKWNLVIQKEGSSTDKMCLVRSNREVAKWALWGSHSGLAADTGLLGRLVVLGVEIDWNFGATLKTLSFSEASVTICQLTRRDMRQTGIFNSYIFIVTLQSGIAEFCQNLSKHSTIISVGQRQAFSWPCAWARASASTTRTVYRSEMCETHCYYVIRSFGKSDIVWTVQTVLRSARFFTMSKARFRG